MIIALNSRHTIVEGVRCDRLLISSIGEMLIASVVEWKRLNCQFSLSCPGSLIIVISVVPVSRIKTLFELFSQLLCLFVSVEWSPGCCDHKLSISAQTGLNILRTHSGGKTELLLEHSSPCLILSRHILTCCHTQLHAINLHI